MATMTLTQAMFHNDNNNNDSDNVPHSGTVTELVWMCCSISSLECRYFKVKLDVVGLTYCVNPVKDYMQTTCLMYRATN
jgi:hypothetical protein